ncbi:MAG: alpha/beta hydrolase domain-containing protein [Candidatus Binatia bacterium]
MITKISIERRELFADGHEFPITGAYEKLVGKVYGEVDPKSSLNKVIVNVDKAPTNSRRRVEYWADLFILKPVEMERGNKKIFFDPPNRGGKHILALLNDAPQNNDPTLLKDAGNGFLMRAGYTVVWGGWHGGLSGKNLVVMGVPVATNKGKEIVGMVRTEIVADDGGVRSMPLSADPRIASYEAASTDKSRAALTVREKSYEQRTPIPISEWEFASYESNGSGNAAIRPSTTDLYLRSGFKPNHLYEFIYPAKNPLVLGLGIAAVRDTVSFLRHEMNDRAGNRNPLAFGKNETGITRAYAWGRSVSGRFIKEFVYCGGNEDESHRKVFDAVCPYVAGGGRMFLNYEFSRPVTSSQQHTDQLDPELFPFAYNVLRDPQTGEKDGIIKRPKTDPYIFHVQTSTEYRQKRGALVHTDGKGRDIAIPEKVRIYVISSAPHRFAPGFIPKKYNSQNLTNPLPHGEVLRALMVAMDRWVCDGTPPPPSQIPRVQDRTLVPTDQRSTGFPKIPGVRYTTLHNRQLFLDYGPNLRRGKIEVHPPAQIKKREYKILVTKVDADGNDRAGIRLPAVQVPVATYTGWNLWQAGLAEDELCGLFGSYIPFAKTKAERQSSGDPRLSLEERYKDHADYVQKVSRAARALVEDRLLLPEDAERIIEEAKKIPIL